MEVFAIPQLVSPGEVRAEPLLPSALYLARDGEFAEGLLDLPWRQGGLRVAGHLAARRGAESLGRLVTSAKSWLSYTGAERTAPILPPSASEGAPRVSPVEASRLYLEHLREAWEHVHPDAHFAGQRIVLTVPASFDAVARELTEQAARQAGFGEAVLLEEPQAAFYAWLESHEDWRAHIGQGDLVLVIDVGGGTTDLSLITVAAREGSLELERVAVGEHLLLGGDNMDLALAAIAERTLTEQGKQLDVLQRRALVHACRRAKETLLADDAPASAPVSLLGRGSRLIGGTLRVDLARDDARALLVDGFFPACAAEDRPARRRAAGLRELGLHYAADAAVTRHLAEFLDRHDSAPTAVLWNGGVMKAAAIRTRVLAVLADWYGRAPRELEGTDLDRAVALGAAYYGQVRRGKGIRIRGGTARAYYIGIESSMPAIPGFPPPVKALCVAPFGMEEGASAELPDDELGLVVGEPSTFRFFASSSRKDDAAGTLVEPEAAELVELDPVEHEVPVAGDRAAGDVVPVALTAHVTEVGTLELWCRARDGSGRWKLEYSVRER